MTVARDEARRTAFKAAYLMGDEGRELFLWLAGENLPAARRAGVLSLYLRWRRDPEFVFGLLDDMAGDVGLPPIWRRGRVLRFVGDLSITIYINHPERRDVIARTSALWARILRRRLRLNQLLFLMRGPIARHVGAVLSARTLRTALLSELQDSERFFRQTPDDRARFLRTVALVDPAEPISDDRLPDLERLLGSDILLHRILAALVIAIHGIGAPEETSSLVDRLYPSLDAEGRIWLLLAYSVPLPETPDAWIPHLETLTARLVEDDRAAFFGETAGILRDFDIGLLPLGLAYGKRGSAMPLIASLLERGLEQDRPLAARVTRGLAAVGLYYPHAVFGVLRPAIDRLDDDADVASALAETLATMRLLHFDLVDIFLDEMHAPDAFRERVAHETDVGLVSRCINWIGYYNNAVHQALHYPKMRDGLLMGGLTALGNAHQPADFFRAYTPTAIDMLEAADFRIIEWTKPDAPG